MIIFLLAILLGGTLTYWGLKKTGALYFFYIPPSDFRAETVVERVYSPDMYESFVFTNGKEAIVFSHFNTIGKPMGKTVKLDLKTNAQKEVNYRNYTWSLEDIYGEAFSDAGDYKFKTFAIYNWLNIESSWGYQTIEIYTKEGEIVGRYNSRQPLRTIRWGKGNMLYFVELSYLDVEGTIKKFLVQ